MIGLEDRRKIAQAIEEARQSGARLRKACEIVGIDARTLQRWSGKDGQVRADRRPGAVRPAPSHALSEAERAQLVRVANEPRFADKCCLPHYLVIHRLFRSGLAHRPNT